MFPKLRGPFFEVPRIRTVVSVSWSFYWGPPTCGQSHSSRIGAFGDVLKIYKEYASNCSASKLWALISELRGPFHRGLWGASPPLSGHCHMAIWMCAQICFLSFSIQGLQVCAPKQIPQYKEQYIEETCYLIVCQNYRNSFAYAGHRRT